MCCDSQADFSYPCCSFKVCKGCNERVKPQGKCPACRKWESGKSDMTDNDGYWWYTPEASPATEVNGYMPSFLFNNTFLALDAIFQTQFPISFLPFGDPSQYDEDDVATQNPTFVLPPLDDETMRRFHEIGREIDALFSRDHTTFIPPISPDDPAEIDQSVREPTMPLFRVRFVQQTNFVAETFHLTHQEKERLGFFAPIPYTNPRSVKDRQNKIRQKKQHDLRRLLRSKSSKGHRARNGYKR